MLKENMFSELKDKVCVVTGGSGVIGKVFVEDFALQGAHTVIISHHKETVENAVMEINEKLKDSNFSVSGYVADVTDVDVLNEVNGRIEKEIGPVDILINSAGGNSPKATTGVEIIPEEIPEDLSSTFFGIDVPGFRDVFRLNIDGTVLPSMAFTRSMVRRKSGCVINISSMNASRPLTKIPAYSGAKAAVNNFTQWLAVHFARARVRVNAIAPGFFLTSQNRYLLTDEKTGDLTSRGARIIDDTPMGTFGDPKDLGGTALFLASDFAKFITGAIIPVDGGFDAFSGV